jgi:uridine kinase
MSSCRIVLVAGGTASGKTSIVQQVVAATGAVHIAHDRYYIDAEDPARHDFDHPDSLETSLLVAHVEALKRGEVVALPRYGFPNHRRQPETDPVGPAGLVIVEGILVLHSEALRLLADLCVYVDAPEHVRLARRLQRDVVERGRSEQAVMARYTAMVKPSHDRFVGPSAAHAGLTLDGTVPVADSVAQLRAAIDT